MIYHCARSGQKFVERVWERSSIAGWRTLSRVSMLRTKAKFKASWKK